MRRIWIGIAAMALSLFVVRAGAGDQSARDVPNVPTGTALIAGRAVVADAGAQPVPRALLVLRGGSLLQPLLANSDDRGRFTFDRLPAGSYYLSAERRGFLPAAFGARRHGGKGAPIVLAEADRQDVTIRLTRHAAINGTVRGGVVPVPAGARVRAMRRVTIDGYPRAVPVSARGGQVDSRGEYRLYGLAPGEYVVAMDARFDPILLDRGSGPQPAGFVSVFAPDTIDLDRAASIALSAGEERSGVDIVAEPAPLARVVATFPEAGAPGRRLYATLVPRLGNPAQPRPGSFDQQSAHFVASLLPPGRYDLIARLPSQDGRPDSGRSSWAVEEITVDGRDVMLAVSLRPGVVLSGRAIFDGEAPRPEPGDTLGVRLQPVHFARDAIGVTRVLLQPDGRFRSEGMIAGAHRVVLESNPTLRWTLAAATLDGIDILDQPLQMPETDRDGAILTFTDRPSRLSGTLTDNAGRAAPDYVVLAFGADARAWTPLSRRVRHTKTDDAGAFAFDGIPPGEYFLCVLTDPDETLLVDRAALSSLISASVRVSVAAREHRVQHLRVSGG